MLNLNPILFQSNVAGTGGKYAPKFNMDERRAVVALLHLGVSPKDVCGCFGINPGTARYMKNMASPFYQNIKDEIRSIGIEAYAEKWVTPAIQERLNAYAQKKVTQSALGRSLPNRNARRHAGHHLIEGKRRVLVYWADAGDQHPLNGVVCVDSGWYYAEPDVMMTSDQYEGEKPLAGAGFDEGIAFPTSTEAYHAAVAGE